MAFYYKWNDNQVKMIHKGYSWKLGFIQLRLPVSWILGRCEASEWALSSSEFAMHAAIVHPFLGIIYAYEGKFTLPQKLN